jgi:hypothetical protein
MATLTTNKNFLSPVGFQFKINSNKYPNLEYFCTAVTLPGFTVNQVATPYKGVNHAVMGDRVSFEDLTIRVNVMEDFENYIETFEWMHNTINSTDPESLKEDATLLVLSSHNNVSKEIKFNGIFPTSLQSIAFDSQLDFAYVQADISFAYTSFEFQP